MQNWNQWQLPAAPPVAAPMPQPPIGYAAPGADPMATMQSYLQYYNQPAPSGYTPEQWATAQQQNWAQWQTWQQQYQQWQAQYGEKYQETMKQMSTQSLPSLGQMPASSIVQPPPLPKEDSSAKPPLPPESGNAFGFPGIPPPHQNNLPLFPMGKSANPPLPPGQPPLPPDNSRNSNIDNNQSGKRVASSNVDSVSAKKLKVEDDELTEAEKTFDAQFKQWEEQFNKWKQQNANHPDKTQYKQYEAKWTSWREKLIERREQMRRKREQQKQAAAKAEAEKDKSLVGGDKILNILSSTENQGLINNLLGIGKTLGLTGKNEAPQVQPQVPTIQPSAALPAAAMGAPAMTPNMNQAAWAAQQWAAQYNAGMNVASYTGYQQAPAVPQPPANALPTPMPMANFNQQPANFNQPPGNFNQPPPAMLGAGQNFFNAPPNMSASGPNFSQPPPGFGGSNSGQQTNSGQAPISRQLNSQDQNAGSFRSDGDQRQLSAPGKDSMNSGNDRFNFEGNRFSGPPPNDRGIMNRGGQFGPNEPYGRDGPNKDFTSGNQFGSGSDNNRRDDSGQDFNSAGRTGNEFRSGNRFGSESDRFVTEFDRDQSGNRSDRGGDKQENSGNNRAGSDRGSFNTDRFGPGNDPFASNKDHFAPNTDRFGSNNEGFNTSNDRFNTSNDRFNTNNDRFNTSNDRFGSNNDRFAASNDRFGPNNDRFTASNDRFSSNNDRFGPNNDRFGSNNDRFPPSNDRSGLNNDRFGPNTDRSGPSNDRFSSSIDQSKPDMDRFGSSNDQFRPSNPFSSTSSDRFGASSDRPGMIGMSQLSDKFSRPPPDRFDSRDGSRDSGGSNSRGFGKSNQFDPPADMPPELQKLMEKRKAAMDVFKPSTFSSFLDSSKNSSTSTSLSESFRKITGDSPFLSRSSTDFSKKDSNLGLRGPMLGPMGASKSGNFEPPRDVRSEDSQSFKFRGPGDFRPQGGADFRPRGLGDFGPRGNEFSPRESGGFAPRSGELSHRELGDSGPRGSDFAPRVSGDFGPRGGDFTPRESGDLGTRSSDFAPRESGDFGPRGSDFTPQKSGDLGPRGSDFAPRETGDFGPRDSDFAPQKSGDFGPRGGEFGTRGSGGFGPRGSEFIPRDSGDFGSRGSELGSQGSDATGGDPKKIGDFPQRPDNDVGPRSGNEFEASTRIEQSNKHQCESFESSDKRASTPEKSERMLRTPVGEEAPVRDNPPVDEDPPVEQINERKDVEETFKDHSSEPVESKDNAVQQNVPPLQMPPWMHSEFADDDIIEIPTNKLTEKTNTASTNLSENTSQLPPKCETPRTGTDESEDQPTDTEKKSDALPFMGENDPKPEDLNMEPPPELPNLGPVIKNSEPHSESREENKGSPFSRPSGDVDRQMNFDPSFGPLGMQMKPRGPMPFGLKNPSDSRLPPFGARDMSGGPLQNIGPHPGPFGSHCSNDGLLAGPRGPPLVDSFKPRGPMIGGGPFGARGPGDFGPRGPPNFGPRGPADFGPRGPASFGPPGPGDFGPRGPVNFPSRGNVDFAPRGPTDFSPRGLTDFPPRGLPPSGFGPRGPVDFPPRDGNDRPFGPRGISPFGPRGPLDRPFGDGSSNEPSFVGKAPFGSNTFAPRVNPDKPSKAIPSLMSFKFDRPIDAKDEVPAQKSADFEANRCEDLPPAFRKGDQDERPFVGEAPKEDRDKMDQGSGSSLTRGPGGSDWREPFCRNKFGDSDQRFGPPDASPVRSGNQLPIDRDRSLSGSGDREKDTSSFGPDERVQTDDKGIKSRGPGFDESSGSVNDKERTGGSNFVTRRSNERRGNDEQKEFCVEKQFNYNHSGGMPDEISKEHSPVSVIDYVHKPRVIVHDYVTPAQCFDYEHGSSKPIVPEHEIYSKQDFRNWIESEQNLREYTDRMRSYDSDMRALKRGSEQRQPEVHMQFRERNRVQDDRRSFDRDRRPDFNRNDRNRRDRDTDDYRERDRRRNSRERGRVERDREWERASNKSREDRSQHRRSKSKDRTRERPEKIRKETSKENKKDDERSKGNVAGSESSAKKPAESTSPDNSKQESNDGEPEPPAIVTEVPKTVEEPQTTELPTTMELPKTPSFTMVDDLLCQPGRQNRPPKIVVILRGPPGSGKSFVAKLIKDREVEQGGSAPRILSLDDYFLTEKETETEDNNGKKIMTKEMVYEYEEAMEPSYITSLIKAFKKNITDGFFNFIILDSINEKISDYEEMWSFAKTKGFRVYVCEMEMDVQICMKRNIHKRTEDEINRIVDYFEPTPAHHQKLDVTSMLQEEAIEEVHMEDSQDVQEEQAPANDDSQDSQEDPQDSTGVSKWERMEAEDKLDRLDGLAKRKNEGKPQTMEDFLQVPDYYNMEDTSGKQRVRWADLEERKKQEKMRAVGFVVGQTNWDRMMDPTKGSSALTRTKFIPPSQ